MWRRICWTRVILPSRRTEKRSRAASKRFSYSTKLAAEKMHASCGLVPEPARSMRGNTMAHHFGSLVFTPVIKALQEQHGSRRQYARLAKSGASPDRLGRHESAFIAERDSFYLASVGETGWPYLQHRGGPTGFLKVIDERTIAFADFSGNKQFISAGNLM